MAGLTSEFSPYPFSTTITVTWITPRFIHLIYQVPKWQKKLRLTYYELEGCLLSRDILSTAERQRNFSRDIQSALLIEKKKFRPLQNKEISHEMYRQPVLHPNQKKKKNNLTCYLISRFFKTNFWCNISSATRTWLTSDNLRAFTTLLGRNRIYWLYPCTHTHTHTHTKRVNNNLHPTVWLQFWNSGECRIHLHCHYSRIHSVPEW